MYIMEEGKVSKLECFTAIRQQKACIKLMSILLEGASKLLLAYHNFYLEIWYYLEQNEKPNMEEFLAKVKHDLDVFDKEKDNAEASLGSSVRDLLIFGEVAKNIHAMADIPCEFYDLKCYMKG